MTIPDEVVERVAEAIVRSWAADRVTKKTLSKCGRYEQRRFRKAARAAIAAMEKTPAEQEAEWLAKLEESGEL